MMTLSEVITHFEELAKKNDDDAKEFYRISKLETHPERKSAEHGYVKCKMRAVENRQLAQWLKELKVVQDIIKQHDRDSMPEDYWYIDEIRTVVFE